MRIMNELLSDIFTKWREASIPTVAKCKFVVNYTSTAVEFMKLLETWRVPYEVCYDTFRVSITTLNYRDVILNKEYYSDNGITAEMEAEYYA